MGAVRKRHSALNEANLRRELMGLPPLRDMRCVYGAAASKVSAKNRAAKRKRKWMHYMKTRTHCPEGHPIRGRNLILTTAKLRVCRACGK